MSLCPSCASDSPDTQNFCGHCGTPLRDTAVHQPSALRSYTPQYLARQVLASRSAIEGERKLVTVLFCDIADSTALAARLGADAMHDVLERFFALALAEVHRMEGTINQFLGDGFMALFGAPNAQEDHARRALLAAAAIQQRLREVASDDAALAQVRLRIGLNTGTVVVGSIGDNLRMDYTAVGNTTNLAARLQSMAEPGTMRISESTQRAAGAHFEFRTLGRHALKGIAGTVPVYDVIRALPGSAHTDSPGKGSPLVGRAIELATLSTSLESLRSGRGGMVIVQGEPGSGKSRLIAEARRRNPTSGMLWLEGRALSFGRHLSYWPFVEVLRSCFHIESSDAEARAWTRLEQGAHTLFGKQAGEVVPYLGTVLSLPLPPAYEERVKFLDAQAVRRQVFLSMRELVARLARQQPVLIALEDWHWVDESSVLLFEHLATLAGSLPLAFWFTMRTEHDAHARRIRAAATHNVEGWIEEVRLEPLPEAESRNLIDNLIGASDLPERVRVQVLRKTDGNPFFIEETLNALMADGTLVKGAREGSWRLSKPVTDVTLPDTVQGVIVARIDRLDERCKSVMKVASVIGRSFFLRILAAVAEADDDDLDRVLMRLEEADFVQRRPNLPELEYTFKHALVQEAAYGSILVERRRTLHRSVAAAVESLFADRLDEFASQLAHHYALAEDWAKAQFYLLKAGDHAGRMAADAEALEHYRKADAAYANRADLSLTPLERATLDRKLSQAFQGVGDYEQAVEYATRALARLGISYPNTRSGIRLAIARLLVAHFLPRFMPGRRLAQPRMELATAREISMVCHSMGWLDYFVDDERLVLDGLIELYAGERGHDTVATVRGLTALALVLITYRAFALAGRRIAEAEAIAQRSADPGAIALAAFLRGWLGLVTGALDKSLAALQTSAATHHRIGDIRGWASACIFTYWIHYWRGEFAPVADLATEMVRMGEQAGEPHVTSWGRNGLGLRAISVGPLAEAATLLTAVYDVSARTSSFRMQVGVGGLLGKIRLRQGRLREAAAILAVSIRLIETKRLRGEWSADPLNAVTELHLGEAERLTGAARQRALRAAARACAKAFRCTRYAATWLPETQRLQGTLAWLAGDHSTAGRRWQQSIRTAERVGMPVERARTLLELGIRREDVSAIAEARSVFERTGARVDLAFALHAQARLAREPRSNIAASIEGYNRAIAELDEVGAEYALGNACRERAQLLSQLGRHNEARSDLERAQSYLTSLESELQGSDVSERNEA
jgi:class 3 adenylate cyclase/tetratricopeptide (TPR) repeat protein